MYSRHFLQSENFRLPVSLICDLFSDIFNNFIQPFFWISATEKPAALTVRHRHILLRSLQHPHNLLKGC